MVKSRSLTVPRPVANRPGRSDGYPLSLLKLPAEQGRSEKTVTFGIDISSAPVPPRRFAAELADVRLADGDARFLFGQRYLDGASIESVVSVRMNPVAVRQLLASIDGMDDPGLQVIADRVGLQPRALEAEFGRPSHMASMVANMAAIAVSGFESCIDFYHASPFAYRDALKSDQIDVEPVVRVDLQTALFMSIVDRMRELSAQLPNPPQHGE